jgi:benzoyl-CoA reductase/2-hydroxyglutaryl-CoA dehydratase subunit BcrC/BadD/HgdB
MEVQRLRELLSVPVLDIDLNGEDAPVRFSTRIQAFIENLI